MFFVIMLIIGSSCTAITYKTLVGYGQFPLWVKALTFISLLIAWFSPALLMLIRHYRLLDSTAYAVLAKTAYFLMGFAFILILLILLREIIWYAIYYISRNPNFNPDNVQQLHRNNFWTLLLTLIIAIYGVYQANKIPNVIEFDIADNRIKHDTRIVVASDLHIDKATPMKQINTVVNLINAQNPDYVLLVGDVIDDTPDALEQEMDALKQLKAKKVYLSLGNHEYYNAPYKWMIKFTQMGFEILHNTGEAIDDTGVYIAGIPDASSAKINFEKATYGSNDEQYKILMSHSPLPATDIEKGQFNLQLSGHTHGGQIFPFHIPVKAFNGYLAGKYEVNGNMLYISRGAGYWGPPMRIFAPSDITVINLKGTKDDN